MKKCLLLITLILANIGSAQDTIKQSEVIVVEQPEVEKNQFKNSLGDLKINLDQSGEKNIKVGLSSQIWLRYLENNPGTAVNNVPQNHTYDAGLRRMRIILNAQLTNAYSIYMQFGINNQSFISGGGSGTGANGAGKKPQLFFMDAYNELAIIPRINSSTKKANKNHFYLGAGLHSWSGISRMTNASTTKMLTADLPVFNFPNIEITDQFSRQFGVFGHGEYNKFNYRVAINKPFATNRQPGVGEIVDNNQSGKLSFAGYGMYQFFDQENTATSFLAGTYLGSKKVFNLGAGIYSTKDATLAQTEPGVFESHDNLMYGIDAFFDMTIGAKSKEMALSVYSVFYRYDFGPNYLRTNGIMNPGTKDPNFTGETAVEGFGNAKYLLGTGNLWYTQAGFVLPKFSNKVKLQPFATYSLKDLEGLRDIAHFYDFGANLYILSQNAKVAYQYSSRPLFNGDTKEVLTRRGEHILTLQIAL
ncbi:porin [Faecalibacter bovis]|uniref:Porin n=1 Tax=Faecalibacter bovis TaxID=2898187 RepID=A0ABX7XEE1_9FLAO|nr:porin [Faecalibacter bovis]QTV06280.1 porin [Faecalibacter bovis]